MDPDPPEFLSQPIVLREKGAAVAVRSQGLAGEKGGRPDGGEAAGLAPLVSGPEALGAVLDHRQAMAGGNAVDGLEIRRLAVEAYRHNGSGRRRDRGLDPLRIDIAGFRLDIHKNGVSTEEGNDLRGGNKAERRRDELVTGPHIQGH